VIVLHGRIAPTAVPVLCELVHDLIVKSHDPACVTCDVSALIKPDEVALDALVRLQLTARRLGTSLQLRNARGDLVDLLAVAGLSDVLPLMAGLGLETNGQAEEREEARVDEEVDRGDTDV
jgi:anti-anti-sigma regulatory factor